MLKRIGKLSRNFLGQESGESIPSREGSTCTQAWRYVLGKGDIHRLMFLDPTA